MKRAITYLLRLPTIASKWKKVTQTRNIERMSDDENAFAQHLQNIVAASRYDTLPLGVITTKFIDYAKVRHVASSFSMFSL